jgi:flavin reductase (DIM6/NTAB) family NADH-FMN oxidoreductase RutF
MRALPLAKVYQLIEPGPVVLLTTSCKGEPDVMTMSWLMPVEFTPPLIACIVSNDHLSFEGLSRTRECVIAIPDAKLARAVVGVGNCSGRETDKFERFRLTKVKSKRVAAPLIKECFANLEAKVVDARLVRAYCLFILEIVKAWVDPAQRQPKMLHHRGDGVFAIDGRQIRLRSQMP